MKKSSWKMRGRRTRTYSLVLLGVFLSDICLPTASLALTSGPTQPEFTSFEPVGTTHMVNEFTGDFTYNLPLVNIPGPNNSGYSMSLAYHSDIGVEQDASWVGLGWSLNPGAINRLKSGIPDDWDAKSTTVYSKSPPSQSVTVGSGGSLEFFSGGVGFSGSLRYNNYKGFAKSASFGLNFGGVVSLGYNLSTDADGSFSLGINPMGILSAAKKIAKKSAGKKGNEASGLTKAILKISETLKKVFNDKTFLGKLGNAAVNSAGRSVLSAGRFNIAGGNHGLLSRKHTMLPFNVAPASGGTGYFKTGLNGTFMFLDMGAGIDLFGSYTEHKMDESMNMTSYGQMYLTPPGAPLTMLDYSTERLQPYKKGDYFLPIPFANKDLFNVTGDGMAGVFQLQHKKNGFYGPNRASSEMEIGALGLEGNVGWFMGGGLANSGWGSHDIEAGTWDMMNPNDWEFVGQNNDEMDEPIHFRFLNDMGGSYERANGETSVQWAQLLGAGSNYWPMLPTDICTVASIPWNNNAEEDGAMRNTRSSYIGYHLNQKIADGDESIYYNESDSYNINRGSSRVNSQVGEYALYSDAGELYTYGLPVYSSHEASISVGLGGLETDAPNNHIAYLTNGEDIHPDNFENFNMYHGSYSTEPYATSYLLTSVTQPDYMDVDGTPGPSDGDFGGYTKFNYERLYPNSSDVEYNNVNGWYKWRTPYVGVGYENNQISDVRDDKGQVQFGFKQIYYLDKIETKTHYAKFETSAREDGFEANHDESIAVQSTNGNGTKSLRRLDEIKIYKKATNSGEDDVLIKRIEFQYDYTLAQELLNNPNGGGKLTLRKVFVESGGVYNAEIAPYEFNYEYPDTDQYPDEYEALSIPEELVPDNNLCDENPQNPSYDVSDIDPWGNYQLDGGTRLADMQNWVNQNPSPCFDPAAWQLKQIILPSGGEIHVQYEQDDYQHVQDQRAHMMVPLDESHHPEPPGGNATVVVDLSGYGLTDDEFGEVERATRKLYAGKSRRMYFKFLYQLTALNDNDDNQIEIDDCNTEYINGYIRIESVDTFGGGHKLSLTLKTGGLSHDLPRQVCVDYLKKERHGMITGQDGNCETEDNMFSGGVQSMVNTLLQTGFPEVGPTQCGFLNHELSYLRIPVGFKKLGGGVRVKRLLTYDPGNVVDNPSGELYGEEYYYKTVDEFGNIVSSGVATNEPAEIREENVLISFLKFFDNQSKFDKIISGRDLRQSEGPFGETLLPSPSVGYSKVIRRSIHSGTTDSGYQESDYFTAKSHPMEVSRYPYIPEEKDEYKYKPYGVYNELTNLSWSSQGYRFYLNDMHGQLDVSADYVNPNLIHEAPNPEGELVYGDGYTFIEKALLFPWERTITGLVKNEYVDFKKEDLKVVHSTDIAGEQFFGVVQMKSGRDIEVAIESRYTTEELEQNFGEFDVGVGLVPLIFPPSGGFMPSITRNDIGMYSNVVSKVISDPAILKKTTYYQNNAYTVQEHTHFSAQSGAPVITKTHDGFRVHTANSPEELLQMLEFEPHEGIYKNFSLPTLLAYDNFSQVALNEGLVMSSSDDDYDIVMSAPMSSSNHTPYLKFVDSNGNADCGLLNNFVTGDKVSIEITGFDPYVMYIADIHSNKLWLENTAQSTESLPDFEFGQAEFLVQNLTIIRSGRNNRLTDVNFNFRTYIDNWTTGVDPSHEIETYTAEDPALAEYQQFVADLNDVIGGGGSIEIPGHPIPENLGLYNAQTGECWSSPFDGVQITISGGAGSLSVNVDNVDEVIVEDHPMVDALNNYFDEYYGYDLIYSQLTSADQTCEFGEFVTNNLYSGNDTPILSDMRLEQISDLAVTFDDVNGQDGVILGSLFQDDGHGSDGISSVFSLSSISVAKNRRVVLVENSSGNQYGISGDCEIGDAIYCVAQCSEEEDCVPFETSHYNISNMGFSQDSEGYLVYKYISYDPSGRPSKSQCRTDIRFYKLVHRGDNDFFPKGNCRADLPENAEFRLNETTGQIEVFDEDNDCFPFPVECLQFCQGLYPPLWVKNVVACESNTFSDEWSSSTELPGDMSGTELEDYELGKRGKWRPRGSYAYNSDIKGIDGLDYSDNSEWKPRNYKTGTFDMSMFNFADGGLNHPQWLELNTVSKYNQDGVALEEENILGTKSAVVMAYDESLPAVVARNATYDGLVFESFEKRYGSVGEEEFEKGMPQPAGSQWIQSDGVHLGRGALDVSGIEEPLEINSVENWWLNYPEGFKVRFWFNSNNFELPLEYVNLNVGETGALPVITKSFDVTGTSGEWMLAEAIVTSNELLGAYNSNEPMRITLHYSIPTFTPNIIIDDLILQPLNAEVQAFVYDVTDFKLRATLDDQHYATMFQYNADGKLVRKNKETERGIKVLKESHRQIPLQPKP